MRGLLSLEKLGLELGLLADGRRETLPVWLAKDERRVDTVLDLRLAVDSSIFLEDMI
jgi:transposase-like protein